MKQLVWSPSSINFGNKKKGESVTAESTLSITEGSALLTPGKISPLPGAVYPVQIKNTEGNLHIHPAFSFAAARYYLTSAGVLTTNRDIAELYLGNAGAGSGLPFLPVPITLVITTPPGEFEPEDPITINYTSSGILRVKAYYRINDDPDWIFYDSYNATGTLEMDMSDVPFSHGDTLHIKVQDDESTSFYDTVDLTAMVKNIVIDSIGTIYLIGEFEDGVDYYALPNGDITTDITGIYLGVGNADGDIDLDIIEYAVDITSPLDSADIALDVPFTFEATTNVQDDRTLHVVAYQGELSVILDELTISGGAISGSVTVSESDGFTTGAVQLLAWYSPVVSTIDTVDVTAQTATITNVASTPASPTEATYFELGGDSAYLVGKTLTLQYSTDDSTWLPLGVATVQGDGTWSKDDCQIATAGTYYLRAVYDVDVVESASLSVSVASGIVLTALQITNATTATADIIRPSQLIKDGDDLYIQFYTLSDKINIKGTDYATGGSASAPVTGILKTDITHSIKWVKFFSLFSTQVYMPSNYMCVTASNVYVISQTYPSSKVNTTVNRLSKTDGSTVNSLALDMERSQAWGTCIGEHAGSIWVVGQVLEFYNSLDRHSIRTWELTTDLSSQTKRTPGYALNNYTVYGKIIGGSAYIDLISIIDLTANTAGAIRSVAVSGANIGINGDGKPLFSGQHIGTNRPMIERRSADLTSVTGTLSPLVNIAWNSKYRASTTYGTDGYYWILYNDDTKFMLGKVTDNESNPLTLANTHNLTPDSVSYMSTGFSDIVETSTHIFIIATLTGNYESGFTPGDNTKTDTILLAVAK